MIGESEIGGVFVPDLLLVALLAFALSLGSRWAFRTLGLYRFVWNAGLLDFALYIVLLWFTAWTTAALSLHDLRTN